MPGAYPEEWLDTPKKRDAFWNYRLGAGLAVLPAAVVGVIMFPPGRFQVVAGVLVWLACMVLVIRYNIFGRLMSRIKWLEEE